MSNVELDETILNGISVMKVSLFVNPYSVYKPKFISVTFLLVYKKSLPLKKSEFVEGIIPPPN